MGDWSHGHPALRVVYGQHWAMGGGAAATAVGDFKAPPSARVVVPYIDANHNGKLDRFTEPSGDCRLIDGAWICSITLSRVTLHRVIVTSNDRRSDMAYVFIEDFSGDGTRIAGSHMCIGHRCTALERGPFLAEPGNDVEALSFCEEEGGLPSGGAVVRLAGLDSTIDIAPPSPLDATITTTTTEGALYLHMSAPPVDRVLIWAGNVNHRSGKIDQIYWTSEEGLPMLEEQEGIAARIPQAALRLCSRDANCELVVQLLKYWSGAGAQLVSATEYRSTVPFREHP